MIFVLKNKIVLLLILSLFCGGIYNNVSAQSKNPEKRKEELRKKKEKELRDSKKEYKKAKKNYYDQLGKKEARKMKKKIKKSRRESKRLNKNKRKFFLVRWWNKLFKKGYR